LFRTLLKITYYPFGITGDKPLRGDFDGDGKTDLAVFKNGVWYIKQSTNGNISTTNFGISGDVSVPGAYINP